MNYYQVAEVVIILSNGLHRDITTRERKRTNSIESKGYYHVGDFLKYVFVFAEKQDNCTYGLGYKLTSQRKSDKHVLSHREGANDAANDALAGRVITDDISWYVPC